MSLPISLIYHKYGSDITGTSVLANPEDYYVGPNVEIDRNAYIEPDVVLGPNVKIGKNAVIYTGSVIRNCIIGDDYTCGENTVIGYESAMYASMGENMGCSTTLGRVIIGNNVEIGACSDVCRGTHIDTIIEDGVKIAFQTHVEPGKHIEI